MVSHPIALQGDGVFPWKDGRDADSVRRAQRRGNALGVGRFGEGGRGALE